MASAGSGSPPGQPGPRLPGRPGSPWHEGRDRPSRPALARDLDVDVAVVGAGIVGLTAALLLRHAGASVAVLERRRVGDGVTGSSTAKVTSLHGLAYSSLRERHGADGARAYAEVNEAGLETIVELAGELDIDCDLRRKPAFTYTEDGDERAAIEREVAAAGEAGLAASMVEECELPFAIAAAIRVERQAEIDPVAYLVGLAGAVDDGEPRVFERSAALGASAGEVRVAGGRRVRAGHVILATQMPFADRGLLFARARPMRSYGLTARLSGGAPAGMYLSADSSPLSARAIRRDGDELLMVAGAGGSMGGTDPAASLARLEGFARRLGAVSIEHRWSAHDYVSEDGLPYVGSLLPRSDRLLAASGMGKWGVAMGTSAARILVDSVLGRDNRWAERFDPWRIPRPPGAVRIARHNAAAGIDFVADRLRRRSGVEDLARGEGRVVGAGPARRAVYRDAGGILHAVSARCTHLGCIVRWNDADRTWDCPCHASRFGPLGEVLQGPATRPLAPREPPA